MTTKINIDELHQPARVTVYEAKDEISKYADDTIIDVACHRLRMQAMNDVMRRRLNSGQALKIVVTETKRKTDRMTTEITVKIFVEESHATD